MEKNKTKTEISFKLIILIGIILSLIWSLIFSYSSYQHKGVIFVIGEGLYVMCFLIIIYGFFPLLIIELIIKWKNRISRFDYIYYSLIVILGLNFLLNRTQDWIMD